MRYKTEELAPGRWLLTYEDKTAAGELLQVELSAIPLTYTGKTSFGRSWWMKGLLKEKIPAYWHVAVYASDDRGNTHGKYNPMTKMVLVSKGGRRHLRIVVDHDWILDATPANREKMLAEIERRAGVVATL